MDGGSGRFAQRIVKVQDAPVLAIPAADGHSTTDEMFLRGGDLIVVGIPECVSKYLYVSQVHFVAQRGRVLHKPALEIVHDLLAAAKFSLWGE